ncbi:MAG: TetR/AcrR family transcriptional regulator [Deltaproteobacteria bacterium]|nr:TetR/AcrR family transcriptional regulator [Deltaproteobacteria bacterium]
MKKFDDIRNEEKLARKDHLAQIAQDIMQKRGIEAVTVRSVATAAGLSPGAVYLYFRTKEEIFVYLLIRRLSGLCEDVSAAMEISESKEAIRAMAGSYREYYLAFGQYIDVFRYLALGDKTMEAVSPEMAMEVKVALARVLGKLEDFLKRPEMARALRGLPPSRGVAVLWCAITGLGQVTLSPARGREGGFDFDCVLSDIMEIFFD